MNQSLYDVLIVGAGPTGMACAIEAQRAGLDYQVLEKGCLVNSLANFPTDMVYFTTSELLEIGDLPLTSAGYKPTRGEAIKYYRAVAKAYNLNIRLYETVERVAGQDGDFRVYTRHQTGERFTYRSRKMVLATGYYDRPNRLGIPGEELAKVSHYYREGHPYYNMEVAVIGGKNSAAVHALDLYRCGARVTLIHRGPSLSSHVKYWIKPDIENRIKAGQILAYFNAQVLEIRPKTLFVSASGKTFELANDFVFAMVGYHPDTEFFRALGIEINLETLQPAYDPKTLQSNVPGLYLAGVILSGLNAHEIFIENGRFHGKVVIAAITQALHEGSASRSRDIK